MRSREIYNVIMTEVVDNRVKEKGGSKDAAQVSSLHSGMGRGSSHPARPSRRGTHLGPECAFGLDTLRHL